MGRTRWLWGAGVALLAGCASVGGTVGMGPEVSAADVGRLSQDDLGPINAAQRQLQAAEQARNHAVLQEDDAKGQLAMAKPAIDAADADISGAQVGLENAQKTGDQSKIQEAARQVDLATTFRKERQARVDYLNHEVDLRASEVTAADRQIALARAQVERSKLVALEQAHNPAATKYDTGLFESAVDNARRAVDSAEQQVATARQSSSASFEGWQAVRRDYATQQGLAPVRGGAEQQAPAPSVAPPPAAPPPEAPPMKQPEGQPPTPGNP